MIKRYGARLQVLCENDAGSYVDYLDHLAALTERDKLIEEMVEVLTEINMIFNMEGRQDGFEKTKNILARAEAVIGGKG